ncbi:S1 family peptidase [Amycolatopsis dongchuanensis]|uniref:Trypsin-like serine protease n=1 Tax=Amycolatopsis dongchuanensis TaxID=1070866 RepID=A0ABP9QIL5_9PSEU
MVRGLRGLAVTVPLVLAAVGASATPASAVLGGSVSDYGPWAVRMLVDGLPECTGTAISPEWVLSAGHCFFELPDAPFAESRIEFRVGSLDQRDGVVVHPVPGSRMDNPVADMTLIKVPPMAVQPARLSDDPVQPGQLVREYGWGATCTEDENQCQSDVLKQADLEVLPTGAAECAGFSVPGGPDFCLRKVSGEPAGGDSGGPVMTSGPRGSEVLVGVLAASDRETMAGAGEISQQREWIRSVTGIG